MHLNSVRLDRPAVYRIARSAGIDGHLAMGGLTSIHRRICFLHEVINLLAILGEDCGTEANGNGNFKSVDHVRRA